MKKCLFILLLAPGLVHAHSGKEKTCAELLDIRNFSSIPNRRPKSLSLEIDIGVSRYAVSIIPERDNSRVLFQIIQHQAYDFHLESLLRNGLKKFFAVHIPKESSKLWVEEGWTPARLEKQIKLFQDSLRLTIGAKPPALLNLNHKSEDLQIQAIRQVLISFLQRNEIVLEAAFYQTRLSRIHADFLRQLTSLELGYFDYAIFTDFLGYELETRVENQDRLWAAYGIQVHHSQIHERMRELLLKVARQHRATYESLRQALPETLNRVSQRLKAYDFAYIPVMLEKSDLDRLRDLQKTGVVNIDELRFLERLKNQFSDGFYPTRPEFGVSFSRSWIPSAWSLGIPDFEWVSVRRVLAEVEWTESNYNPFAMSNGRPFFDAPEVLVKTHAQTNVFSGQLSEQVLPGVYSDQVMRSANRAGLEHTASEDLADDSLTLISEAIHDPEIVSLLEAYGIRRIYEITRYSAEDYLTKFHFSDVQFERFLDELNVLAIHLHFDSDWDKASLQIRRRRPEFYEYRHTPGTVVKWRSPATPTDEVNRASRPDFGREWD